MSDAFLGMGWPFPLLPDGAGRLGYVSGEDSIAACLLVLLQTAVGERVMRPELGTTAAAAVFAPASAANLRELEATLRDAIVSFEPRVTVDDVAAERSLDDPTQVIVSLAYRVRLTNTPANLVFPFYLDSIGPAGGYVATSGIVTGTGGEAAR